MIGKRKNYKKYILYFLFLLTPVFALLLLCIIQKISIFDIDWWNSTWNDEVIYHKIVKVMREYGYPTGVCSYNEVESQYPSYGAWIITAYIPYWLFSFITGTEAHSFMIIANVIMVVLANCVFCRLVRPDGRQIFFLSMFSVLSLAYERHVWSGMNEGSICAMIIIVTAIVLRIVRDSERSFPLLGIAAFLILFFGISRPFLLVYLLYVWGGIWLGREDKTRKWVYSVMVAFLAIAALFLYFYLASTCSAKFFHSNGMAYFGELLKNKEIKPIMEWVFRCNADAVKLIRESFSIGEGIIFVVLGFIIEWIILIIMCIKEKDKAKKIFLAASIVIGFAIYEAVIILYLPGKLDRMLLVCVVGFSYMICIMFGRRVNSIYLGLQILCLFLLPISKEPSLFLPVKTENVTDYRFLQDSLEEALGFSENGRWENTVALVPPNDELYLLYCFPAYTAFGMCTEDYLENAIETNTLKSKYIYLEEDSILNNLCAEKYPSIWQQEGHVIYENLAGGRMGQTEIVWWEAGGGL